MKSTASLLVSAAIFCLSSAAQADSVTFENIVGPSIFPFAASAPLVYSFTGYTATFSGGTVLTGESNQTTDNSSVYATTNLVDGTGYHNPLTITFSAAIQNLQLDILNALAGSYELADNAGHVFDFSLATTGGSLQTVGFAATGTVVTITSLNAPSYPAGQYDFAIDNVTFNQPLTAAVPEPGTYALMALGLGAMGFVARRRKV
jgi:hypothetical protein